MPKSNKERQALLRKRRAEQGLIEVRGIYAKKEDIPDIKDFANSLKQNKSIYETPILGVFNMSKPKAYCQFQYHQYE
jgi:hypothetical protein